MAKFNDLIKEDPQLAAGMLQNAFIHVVNNMIPNIYLKKEEYKELVKIILAGEAKDPDEVAGADGGEDNSEPSDPSTDENASGGDDSSEEGTP